MTNRSRFARRLFLGAAMTGALALGGCYVVPLHPPTGTPHVAAVQAPAMPSPVTFSARLYPANDMAATYGPVTAVVTNDLNGRGYFTTNIHGESYSGEATRVAGSSREGLANGAGNRGGYINCRYTMNTATMGTGNCRHSSGASFTMHVGG
jgi:hypothetical protein